MTVVEKATSNNGDPGMGHFSCILSKDSPQPKQFEHCKNRPEQTLYYEQKKETWHDSLCSNTLGESTYYEQQTKGLREPRNAGGWHGIGVFQ